MNDNEYKITGSRTTKGLDAMGNIATIIEVHFEWGEAHSGVIEIKQQNATKDEIAKSIREHIALFSGY